MSKSKDPRDDTNYQDAPEDVIEALKSARRIEDTLPPPEELVRKKQSVTIRLDTDVVEWFKEQGGQYQTLINEVLRRYKDHFSGRRAS
ncbi:MAG: BrnA antitoxin family protein [Spirochaetia bacterium]